jgi:SAM-dependent methyltransferase
MPSPDPRERFSNRADAYVRGRPGYPAELIATLRREFGLTSAHVIADIGSGTGILSALFLQSGSSVFGVEPNAAMRATAESAFTNEPRFTSIAGTAEETTLSDASCDWVAAAQAFHWFQVEAAAAEFRRILRSPGHVAIIWNNRQLTTPFMQDFQALIDSFETDTVHVTHEVEIELPRLNQLFGEMPYERFELENPIVYDFGALRAFTHSASYLPAPGHPRHTELNAAVERVFEKHARDGQVTMKFHTNIFAGRLI